MTLHDARKPDKPILRHPNEETMASMFRLTANDLFAMKPDTSI
jgi:hypothetical protein